MHIDELAEPLAYEERQCYGRQLNGRAREDNADGIAFFVVTDRNSLCALGEKKRRRSRLSTKVRLSPLSLTRFGGKCSPRSGSARLRNCSHSMCYFRLSVGLAKGTRGMPKRAWQTSLVLSMWAISRSRSGEWFRNQGRFAAARDKSFVTIPVGVSS